MRSVQRSSWKRKKRKNRRQGSRPTTLLMVNARLAEQRKARMYRVGTGAVILSGFSGLVWLGAMGVQFFTRLLFTENPRFSIQRLDLKSDDKLKFKHIKEYAHLEEGQNLFAVDLAKIQKDLESVPLVSSVDVFRRLPDTLGVRVAERVAIARLGKDDRRHHLAVDREGYVLGPSSRSSSQPALEGFQAEGLRPGSYLEDTLIKEALSVIELCETTRLGHIVKISQINVDHPEYLDLRLRKNIRVLMGRDKVEWRLKRLASILQKASSMGRRIFSVDLTVDKNFPTQFQ